MFRPNVFIMRWVCIAIFLTSMHIVNYSASAATVPGDAKQYMDKLATKTLGILGNKDIPLTEREHKVRTLLGENLALEATSFIREISYFKNNEKCNVAALTA